MGPAIHLASPHGTHRARNGVAAFPFVQRVVGV